MNNTEEECLSGSEPGWVINTLQDCRWDRNTNITLEAPLLTLRVSHQINRQLYNLTLHREASAAVTTAVGHFKGFSFDVTLVDALKHKQPKRFSAILFYNILLYCTLFYSSPLDPYYTLLFYSVLFYLLYCASNSILLFYYLFQFYSTLLYSSILC